MTAKFAALVDKFTGLTPDDYARMTDRVLHEVYFHPRTKEGAIELPAVAGKATEEPATLERDLADLEMLRLLLGSAMTEDDYLRVKREVYAKHGKDPQ